MCIRDSVKSALGNRVLDDYHKLVREVRKERMELVDQCRGQQYSGQLLEDLAAWFKQYEGVSQEDMQAAEAKGEELSSGEGLMRFLLKDWLQRMKARTYAWFTHSPSPDR
eukprot:TRINITY_DN6510_c0_g1_i3.p2 TRINITY_DN6510_c0_g1~~TRINITY_DN6510_c0_g1_i3.p2  ORF type:complete len:110 (-),score=37.72 TRINITY_DN6510_c0_g1_i3:262-591(-)